MNPQQAVAALDDAFSGKRPPQRNARTVGVFGNGLPESFLSAMGFAPADAKTAPEADLSARAPDIEPYVEPFVDDYARIFLHRLFSGRLDDLHAIVFCRDDAAAFVAYQYARELVRQAVGPSPAPRLVLWNLVHRDSGPSAAFNARQVDKLLGDLGADVGAEAFADSLKGAVAEERRRGAALSAMEALRKANRPTITGTEAFTWRNAGRSLAAAEHADLLESACAAAASRTAPPARQRIGLIGSSTDSLALMRMIEDHGALVTDLQPLGDVWPGPLGGDTLDDILRAEATDPFCPRAEPAVLHRDALVSRCVEDRCDLVVAQLDQNDDSVGWDLPSLDRALGERGIRLVNLGFRDHRPDDAWLASASKKMRSVSGALA
ncbi:2-hydroxyacyl-CoA dehydratase family protein [Oricola sp.]|uniref:2-hydroxyacyl-CoA dehydratase family protein n=1 Tax=Oricola sp. TaxID=1979950 RepID=UPI0025F07225|nr:2-hydroxyacyl-CoA dehydratase family protein [Oricola sp.]MCI5078102.1 2-hydroxyacyl-CoA dehydratase family protein [Oricola sp.]